MDRLHSNFTLNLGCSRPRATVNSSFEILACSIIQQIADMGTGTKIKIPMVRITMIKTPMVKSPVIKTDLHGFEF